MKTKLNLYLDISKYFKFTLLVTTVVYMCTTTNGCKKDDNTDADATVPVTYSLSDMLGTWQRHSLVTSSSNNGFWIYGSIINSGVSSTVHLILPNGTFDTVYTSFNGSISSTGVLTTSDDPAAHSYMSADKKLIFGTKGDDADHAYSLVVLQKMP